MGDDADLKIAGFRLWVYGRPSPELDEKFEAGWLSVKCECEACGAMVQAEGEFLSLIEIRELRNQMERLSSGALQDFELEFFEPELKISFKVRARGTVEFVVELTPDQLRQQHRFVFDIDISYLAGAISQCDAILREYTLRGGA